MKAADYDDISMNGRMAYAILCVEQYLLTEYPEEDWTLLSRLMWKATSMHWDEWDDMFIEVIPRYLFEFETYEEAGFEHLSKEQYTSFSSLLKHKPDTIDRLLMNLHKIQEVYSYSSIPGKGTAATEIILNDCAILEKDCIPLPDIEKVRFSRFDEKSGWGNPFNGESLSLILPHN